MKKTNYRLMLVGEYFHKRNFLKECMPDSYKARFWELSEQYAVPIELHGSGHVLQNSIAFDADASVLRGSSNILPAHISIFCENADNTDTELRKENYKSFDKLVFISSWQYEYGPFEAMLRCIPDLLYDNPFREILVVIFESDIRSGATDMGFQQNAIEKAFDKYQKYHDNVLILKRGASVLKAIRPNFQLEKVIPAEYCKTFQEWKQNLEDADYGLRFDFEDVSDNISERYMAPETLDRQICGFPAIAGSKDVIKTYSDNFYNRYYGNAEKQIVDFYLEHVNGVCAWDMESDLIYLKENLLKKYRERTLPKISKMIPAPENRIAYDAIEAEFGMKTEFYSGLRQFYETDVIDFMIEHLRLKARKIETYLEKILHGVDV